MPVFARYPDEKDKWVGYEEKMEKEQKQQQEDDSWLKEFRIQTQKAERVFEIIENPVAQKSVISSGCTAGSTLKSS